MVRLESCCYFCGLRTGCIISALWLLLYYGLLAYFMYYQMIHTQRATVILESREFEKETIGFWVLGIAFIAMACTTLLLVYATIMVGTFYIDIYCLTKHVVSVLLFYIDLVVYSYFHELRSLKRMKSVSEINIEY
ncbi:uncharacterized protein LOC108029452 isoform X2 [Drosophila biarmipes]|uniref:uncharacterized protein LOC108029452 isoform X2 n=1 Tax=Drosophila biarmipes TaxID=125945 RepID=UPI0007E6D124|nr:uncharacterized protein LOC108029452 isoform X2 [Drosophila biarmipes]